MNIFKNKIASITSFTVLMTYCFFVLFTFNIFAMEFDLIALKNEALQEYKKDNLVKFDMDCGDNSCQVRAHKLLFMHDNKNDLGTEKEQFLTYCYFGKKFKNSNKIGGLPNEKTKKLKKQLIESCIDLSCFHLNSLAGKLVLLYAKTNFGNLVKDLQESLKQVEYKFGKTETMVNPKSCATISNIMLIFLDLLAENKIVCLKCTNICTAAKSEFNLFFKANKDKSDFELIDEKGVSAVSEDTLIFVVEGQTFSGSEDKLMEGLFAGKEFSEYLQEAYKGKEKEKAKYKKSFEGEDMALAKRKICEGKDCSDCSGYVDKLKNKSFLNDIIFPNAVFHKQFPDEKKSIKFEDLKLNVLKNKFEEFSSKSGVNRNDMSLFLIKHIYVELKKNL